jgi:hypothetical protein
MGTYMLIIACLTATHPPVAGAGIQSAGIASLTMIYLEASRFRFRTPEAF